MYNRHSTCWIFGFALIAATVVSCRMPQGEVEPMRVMTWNIRYNNPGDGPSAWPNRRARVGALVRFVDPDVVGFQEALRGQVDDLAAMLPAYHWVGVGRDDGDDGGEFSPVFYRPDRVRLRDSGTLWLSATPQEVGSVGWDAALPRIATWVEVMRRVGDRYEEAFVVLNTHFDHVGVEARRRSAELLRDTVAAWSARGTVILVGDFNATPDSEPYGVLASSLTDARVDSPDHHGPDETFFGFLVADTLGRSIDHIFVEGGTEVLRTAVLTDHYRGRYLSDHLPVVADVFATPASQ